MEDITIENILHVVGAFPWSTLWSTVRLHAAPTGLTGKETLVTSCGEGSTLLAETEAVIKAEYKNQSVENAVVAFVKGAYEINEFFEKKKNKQ